MTRLEPHIEESAPTESQFPPGAKNTAWAQTLSPTEALEFVQTYSKLSEVYRQQTVKLQFLLDRRDIPVNEALQDSARRMDLEITILCHHLRKLLG